MNPLTNNIITEPFYDSGYEEIGIVSLFNEGTIKTNQEANNRSLIRRGIQDVNSYIYNDAVSSMMHIVSEYMGEENIDFICNAKITITIPTKFIKRKNLDVPGNDRPVSSSLVGNTFNKIKSSFTKKPIETTGGDSVEALSSKEIKIIKIVVFFTGTAMRRVK